jgi:hypothetical protein
MMMNVHMLRRMYNALKPMMAATPQDGQVMAYSAASGGYVPSEAGAVSQGPQGEPGEPGQDGADGHSVTVFDQPTEPVTAVTGDIWIVP